MPPQPPPSRRAASPRHPRPSPSMRRHHLALRKELVLTRIALQRAELVQATHVTRERLRSVGWVRYLLFDDFARRSGLNRPPNNTNAAPSLTVLLQRCPPDAVVSLALSGLTHTRLARVLRSGLQWASLGVLAWQSFSRWQDTTKLTISPTGTAAKPEASAPAPTLAPLARHHGALPLM